MENQDFTTSIVVTKSPQEVFDAVTNVRGWWSEDIEGNTASAGDEFSYHFKDIHRCDIRLTEAIPAKLVVWHVLDNHFNFINDQTEWKGTEVRFEITEQGGNAVLHFTHVGLTSAYECFDVCSNAWGTYVNGSLRNLIMTGKGNPNPRDSESESK